MKSNFYKQVKILAKFGIKKDIPYPVGLHICGIPVPVLP